MPRLRRAAHTRPRLNIFSVNVGEPRDVEWDGDVVRTAFFKTPVAGRIRVRRLNIDGDRQADLSVHGGPDKAVYAYPMEHYAFWRGELPGVELPWGSFGENLTTTGLTEETLNIGDRIRAGSAEFIVRQPRTPCYKLNLRFRRHDMVKRFLRAARPGFYLAVLEEGEISPGDAFTLIPADPPHVSVAQIASLFADRSPDPGLLRRASELPALPEDWREYFAERVRG